MTDIVKFCYDPIIRDVPDFPDYQVSTNGEVYNKKTGKELKITNDIVRLLKNKKEFRKNIKILIKNIYNGEFLINLYDCVEVKDFPDYVINKNGKIYNKNTKKELKCRITSFGYMSVCFHKNKESYTKMVHKLLAETFIENPKNKQIVDHIDRNKLNNNLNNLRWANKSENATNINIPKNNTSGYIGVSFTENSSGNKYWLGDIRKNGEIHRKCFLFTNEGLQEAIKWRKQKEEELHTYD